MGKTTVTYVKFLRNVERKNINIGRY